MSLDDRLPSSGGSDDSPSTTGAHVRKDSQSARAAQSIPLVGDSADADSANKTAAGSKSQSGISIPEIATAQADQTLQADSAMGADTATEVASVEPVSASAAKSRKDSSKKDSKERGSKKRGRKKKDSKASPDKSATGGSRTVSASDSASSSASKPARMQADQTQGGRADANRTQPGRSRADRAQVGTVKADWAPAVEATSTDPSFTASMRAVRSEENAVSGSRPAILFEDVTKIYDAQPDKPALQDVTVEIYPGEFVFLVGHSGSGKSTFIRLINRELVPTSGRIVIAGEDLTEMRSWRVPYLRRNIGCVFQDFKLLPKKTTFENVAFALEVIGKSKHIINTQVPEVLRLVGLEDKMDKYPDQLSGGEQQRVSIARAIVNRPPILICDEPTGNLDPQTSLGIMRLLDRINRTGTVVLVATHDREMVNSMRRRVITLEEGRVIRDQSKGVYGLDA